MSLPNFTDMTLAEIQALITAANVEYHERYYERQEEVQAIQDNISTTILEIETLLGPETTEPSIDHIRGVRNYSGEEMSTNAAIALPLSFQGLEMLAETTLKLAKIVASQNDRPV